MGNDDGAIISKKNGFSIFRVGGSRGRESDTVEAHYFEHSGEMKVSLK